MPLATLSADALSAPRAPSPRSGSGGSGASDAGPGVSPGNTCPPISASTLAAASLTVSRGGLHPGVAEQAGDRRQGLAGRQRAAGEGVAEFLQAHVVEPGEAPRARPLQEDAGQVAVRPASRHDPRIPRDSRDSGEDLRRCRGDRHGARPGLGIAQPEFARLQPHILPAQRQDLVAPAAGEREQADRRRVRRDPSAPLQLVERPPAPAELGNTSLPRPARTAETGWRPLCRRLRERRSAGGGGPPHATARSRSSTTRGHSATVVIPQHAPSNWYRRRIGIAAAIGPSTRSGPLSQDRDHSTSVSQGRVWNPKIGT